jgi:hypothetical protein
MVFQAVFVCETIETGGRGVFGGENNDDDRTLIAAGFVIQRSVEDALAVLPQRLHFAEANLGVLRFQSHKILPSLLTRKPKLRGNIHQVGERAGIHLSHHLASVRLDGNLADTELEADLFIQQTADHQRHDLPLAGA